MRTLIVILVTLALSACGGSVQTPSMPRADDAGHVLEAGSDAVDEDAAPDAGDEDAAPDAGDEGVFMCPAGCVEGAPGDCICFDAGPDCGASPTHPTCVDASDQ